ncbi:substrate-binding domain-containing protein [Tundrisphaera sp. TA3]|uniref:substrate-binding domain-containing protein n=1 Tax=Tundrisphaera sp. TA3 TaxID=3435775 RepID=UPI003EBA0797
MRCPLACLAVLVGGMALVSGCGPDPSAPRPELIVAPNTVGSAQARSLYLILPSTADAEAEFLTWIPQAESEAAAHRVIFRPTGPPPGSPPSAQVEAIRRAVAEGASMLVVVPAADPGVPKALAEAEGRGIAVVTLGAAAEADPPLPGTAVVPEPFAESAAKLVRAVVEDAGRRGLPADPPAALLFDRKGDRFAADRVKALQDAAAKAGLTHLEPLGYEIAGVGEGRTEALKVLAAWMETHPETAIVLAEGDESLAAADRYRAEATTPKPILVAGYMGFRGQTNPHTLRDISGFVEGRLDVLAREAVRVAVGRAGGDAGGRVVVVATPFNRGLYGGGEAAGRPVPGPDARPVPSP